MMMGYGVAMDFIVDADYFARVLWVMVGKGWLGILKIV